jgi:hypothetical protein
MAGENKHSIPGCKKSGTFLKTPILQQLLLVRPRWKRISEVEEIFLDILIELRCKICD